MLYLITQFGFVTRSEIDMLWSVLTGQPKKFSNYILSNWLKRGGYLLKTPKSKSPVSKTVFRPNRNCEDYQQTAQKLVDYVNQGQEWNASLLSAEHYAQADAKIKFRYRHTERNYVQPVIFGQEHGLDTIIRTHILTVEADQHPQTHNYYPIIISPRTQIIGYYAG